MLDPPKTKVGNLRNLRLRPKSAFLRFPAVHRADLERQQRVETGPTLQGPVVSALIRIATSLIRPCLAPCYSCRQGIGQRAELFGVCRLGRAENRAQIANLPVFLPVTRERPTRRPVFRDCAQHHPVLTNSGGFRGLRKSTPFQRLGGTKRSLRSRFPSFAPAERLERPPVSSDKNSVSQSDGCLLRKGAGSVKRHSDIEI